MNIKKPKFWDYKQPNIYAYILLPVAFLVKILNFFKIKSKKKKSKIKTICVGNFYVGGTGKTSLSIKINEILKKKNIRSCFVKKFYKNQDDEQKLLKNKGKLFLFPKRIDAINKAVDEGYEVAILDDGLQDNSLSYDLSFVCFNNLNWIGNGLTIPAGPLRESVENLKKYDHIFLNGNLESVENLKKSIYQINPKINIYVGIYKLLNLDEFSKHDRYLVFSGIGNHQTFISTIKDHGLTIIKDIEFPDHFKFAKSDIHKILNEANHLNCKIITTEKDYLRLENEEKYKIKYLKSELQTINEEKLIKIITEINETS